MNMRMVKSARESSIYETKLGLYATFLRFFNNKHVESDNIDYRNGSTTELALSNRTLIYYYTRKSDVFHQTIGHNVNTDFTNASKKYWHRLRTQKTGDDKREPRYVETILNYLKLFRPKVRPRTGLDQKKQNKIG